MSAVREAWAKLRPKLAYQRGYADGIRDAFGLDEEALNAVRTGSTHIFDTDVQLTFSLDHDTWNLELRNQGSVRVE